MPLKIFVFCTVALCLSALPLKAQETAEAEKENAPIINEVLPSEPETVVEDVKAEPAVENEEPAPVPEVKEVPKEEPAVGVPHISGADPSIEEKEKVKEDRRARREAWIKAHPEQLKVMQENRLKRQQWMKDHPQEALRMKEEMRVKQLERKLKMQAEAAAKSAN